jgi:hypothetical protein
MAWMSGAYYIVRPDISRAAGTTCGWLRVGPPDGLKPPRNEGWSERMVEPEPGNLVLMPGYFHHSTQPMAVNQERVCIAFDVIPAELKNAANALDEY